MCAVLDSSNKVACKRYLLFMFTSVISFKRMEGLLNVFKSDAGIKLLLSGRRLSINHIGKTSMTKLYRHTPPYLKGKCLWMERRCKWVRSNWIEITLRDGEYHLSLPF